MKVKMLAGLFGLGLAFSGAVHAQSVEGGGTSDAGNGGDFVTGEFRVMQERIIRENLLPLYAPNGPTLPDALTDFRSRIYETLDFSRPDAPIIEITTQPLIIRTNGVIQEFDALNWRDSSGRAHIRYNILRWNSLDACQQALLINHEIFGLLGIESTGSQNISESLRTHFPACRIQGPLTLRVRFHPRTDIRLGSANYRSQIQMWLDRGNNGHIDAQIPIASVDSSRGEVTFIFNAEIGTVTVIRLDGVRGSPFSVQITDSRGRVLAQKQRSIVTSPDWYLHVLEL